MVRELKCRTCQWRWNWICAKVHLESICIPLSSWAIEIDRSSWVMPMSSRRLIQLSCLKKELLRLCRRSILWRILIHTSWLDTVTHLLKELVSILSWSTVNMVIYARVLRSKMDDILLPISYGRCSSIFAWACTTSIQGMWYIEISNHSISSLPKTTQPRLATWEMRAKSRTHQVKWDWRE